MLRVTCTEGREPIDRRLADLLASPAFAGCRREAVAISTDPGRLRELMRQVEQKQFAGWDVSDSFGRVNVDIACAVLDARIEELECGAPRTETGLLEQRCDGMVDGAGADASVGTSRLDAAAIIAGARLQLFVAVLYYFAKSDDTVPDHTLPGHLDDLTLLRWVIDVARRELPALS